MTIFPLPDLLLNLLMKVVPATSRFHHTRHTQLVRHRHHRYFFPTPLTRTGMWHYLKSAGRHECTGLRFSRHFNMGACGNCGWLLFPTRGWPDAPPDCGATVCNDEQCTQLLPTVRTVAAPHGPSCDVITFDFVPQLFKLLQNQTIMTQDNLLIDVHNPLLPYKSPDGVRGKALSGQVYQDVYRRLVTNP